MESGIYEQIINKQLSSELEKLPGDCKYQEKVDAAEASKVLATYVAGLLQHKMDCMYESSGDNALSDQIMYINKVINAIDAEVCDQNMVEQSGEQLLSVLSQNDEDCY